MKHDIQHITHTWLTYLPTYLDLPTYFSTYLHVYLPTYLDLPFYLPTCLPTYLHTYPPTYLPIYLPTYLPTYLLKRIVWCMGPYSHTFGSSTEPHSNFGLLWPCTPHNHSIFSKTGSKCTMGYKNTITYPKSL